MPQEINTDHLTAAEPDVAEGHTLTCCWWADCDYEGEEDLDINDD